jgi:hypothetical protein
MTNKAAMDQQPDVWRAFTKPRGTRDPELTLGARAQSFQDQCNLRLLDPEVFIQKALELSASDRFLEKGTQNKVSATTE